MKLVLNIAIFIVVVGLLLVIIYYSRKRTLHNRVGSFGCWYREDGDKRWVAGVAHYGNKRLIFFRRHSFALRPKYIWNRNALQMVERQRVSPERVHAHMEHQGLYFQLRLVPSACDGLRSWIEAGPTREHNPVI